ncbi:DinB family protein [Chloroflexota bacterium]
MDIEWQQLIIDAYERIARILEKALYGLTTDELNQQPNPDCNSMGWLTWHLSRWQDRIIAELMDEEQLWITGGWYGRFNRAPDTTDTGLGHTVKDLSEFNSPDARTLLEYHHAVLERSKRYIGSLSAADLGRETGHQRFPTVGARIIGVLSDNLQHAGQVAYLRGLLKGFAL